MQMTGLTIEERRTIQEESIAIVEEGDVLAFLQKETA